MSYEEAMMWGAYRKKNGPFDVQSRIEYQLAYVCALLAKEKDLKKFIPWLKNPELTPDLMLSQLKGVALKNGKQEPRNPNP